MDRSKWEYKKLSDVSDIIMGQSPSSDSYNEDGNGLPFYQGNADFGELHPTARIYCDAPSREADSDDILMSVRAPIGAINIANEHCCIGRGLCAIRPIPKVSDKMFLFYFLRAKNAFLNLQGTGSTFKSISKKVVYDLNIQMPPIADQQRIVAELDCLNEMIALKQEQLKEFDKLAQSIFYDMFGDPVSNEKGWDIIELGTKCEVTSFKRVLIEEVVDSGIPFIRGTELMALSKATKGEQIDFSLFITPEHYERVKAISGVPRVGDLLIPSINSDGNIWILDTDEPRYYKDGRVLWVHVNHDTFSSEALKYIMHILLKKTYSLMATGATFAELKLFVLRELKVPVPPLALQQQFADKISAIEAQKELVKQSIAETQSLLDYTMDKYFG